MFVCVSLSCIATFNAGACLFYLPHNHVQKPSICVKASACLLYFITDDINENSSAVTHKQSRGDNDSTTKPLLESSDAAVRESQGHAYFVLSPG